MWARLPRVSLGTCLVFRRCRCRTGSRRSASWSPTPRAAWSTATAGVCTTQAGRIRRRYNGKRWIACRMEFRGWHRHPLMQPGRFTELFFLDEATAFAAGHRPCALCRREDYTASSRSGASCHPGQAGADAIDAQLHTERVDPATRGQRLHEAPLDDLPDGTFVLRDGEPWLVLGRRATEVVAGGLRRAKAATCSPASGDDHAPIAGRGPASGPAAHRSVPAPRLRSRSTRPRQRAGRRARCSRGPEDRSGAVHREVR